MDIQGGAAMAGVLSIQPFHGGLGTVQRVDVPGLGTVAWCVDPGEALAPGSTMFATNLHATHYDASGAVVGDYDLGSGVATVQWVNTMVLDAVNGASMVPTLSRFKYMDTGVGSTAATDGDTALQTPVPSGPARAVASLGNGQTATTSNHAAILTYTGIVTYTAGPTFPVAVTEWGLFDASSSGNMADHRTFPAVNMQLGNSILFTYSFTIPSNA